MVDTSPPPPFDFESWFSSFDDKELDTVLKEIDDRPQHKGKARAIRDSRTLYVPRPLTAPAPLKTSSRLMADTSPPGPVDVASWLSTLDEIDTELKENVRRFRDKGKARASEPIWGATTNDPLSTLSSLTAKPYIFGESKQRRARKMTFPCRICFEDQLEVFAVYVDPCGHPFCR